MNISDERWERNLLDYVRRQREKERGAKAEMKPEGGTAVAEAGGTVLTTRAVATGRIGQPVAVNRPQESKSPIARPLTTTPLKVVTMAKPFAISRPRPVGHLLKTAWVLDALPHRTVDPAPSLAEPVRSGDFLLWADPPRTRAFFALAEPRLQDFNLTVRRERVAEGSGTTIRTTGGSAVLDLSVYAEEDLESLERHRSAWTDQLANAGHGRRNWRFEPLTLRNLAGSLDLPSGYAASPPRVASSADSGRAAILVELTPTGAQAWQDAIEENRPGDMQGICRLTARYYAQLGDHIDVRSQDINATLGPLAADAGIDRSSLRVMQPEVSVEAKFVVAGDDMLEQVALSLSPSGGHEPVSHTFSSSGGIYALALTSDRPQDLALDWTALVHFKPDGWPVVRHSGTMRNNNWAEMIKPDAWMQPFTLVVMLLDAAGDVIPRGSDEDVDPNNRVYGEVTFTAPYLDGAPLRAAFESSSQQMVEMQFPMPPDVPPGEIKLTVMSQRGGAFQMETRVLRPDETSTLVSVMHNAMIQIQTNRDPSSEASLAGQVHGLVSQLQTPKPPPPPRVEAGGPEILGPTSHPVSGGPPTFEVNPSPNPFYAVEVTTDAMLFDTANTEDMATDANF